MSNWLSEQVSDEQRQIDELTSKGMGKPTVKEEPGFFQGVPRSLATGPLAGVVKTYEAVRKPISSLTDYVEWTVDDFRNGGLDGPVNYDVEKRFSTLRNQREKERNDIFLAEIAQLEDAENTGTGGRIVFGVGDFATRAFLGSLAGGVGGAVLTTGLSETNYSYEDLKSKGVDADAALTVAAVDGAVAGASAALPLSLGFKGTGGLVKDGLISIGGATGISLAGQYASGQILEANDYEKQAKKYEITSESVAIEVGLNALMFGAGRYAAQVGKGVDTELKDLSVDEIETRNTQIESGLVLNELDAEKASSPVKTTDPIQENNHLANLDTATKQIKEGKPVSVKQEVKGEPKPVRSVVIPPSEFKKIRYDDPRLDVVLRQKAKAMDMEWATPLLLAIRRAGEKSHNSQVSPKGAQSIMQIMPDTKTGLERNYKKKWDIDNPEHATEMALYLVREMSEYYGTKDPLILAAHYNGGFSNGKAMQKNGKPKALETINYVNRVSNFINNGEHNKYTGDGIQTVHAMDGSSYDVMPEVRSIDDLIASNDSAFGVNPDYPADLQPRDRTRAASRDQIESMANDLRPELLSDSPKISDGSPILGPDGVVESGNGRTMAIRQAYEAGKADNYKAFVEQYAAERGWDISGIKNPVLVRNRLTETDRVEFARLANVPDVAQFSSSERARSDVDRLPDSSMLKINNDGSINLDGSMDYVRAFVDQLPKSERTAVMTEGGRLSQSGKQRIESALAQRAYNDSNLITRLYENLDDDSKTVLNSLLKAAPQLAQLGDLVKQGGRHQNSIASDLAQAAQKLSDIKANGGTVRDYLNQGQLIDDGLSPGAREFLSVFDSNNRSAKAIGEHIQSKIDEVEAMGDPRQGSLFGQTIEEQQALEIIMNNPDQKISVSRIDPDGNVEEITMTLRERLDELEAEAMAAKEEGIAAEAAANCALQFG